MKWPVALGIVVASALPIFGQATARAVFVLDVRGRWCRQTTVLVKNDVVNLGDAITYCGATVDQADKIVIRFDGDEPYDRPYLCSTPGICDTRAKLFLAGPSALQQIRSTGGVLQSAPRISSLTKTDGLFQNAKELQTWTLKVGAAKEQTPELKLKRLEYCLLDSDGRASNCSSGVAFIPLSKSGTAIGAFLEGEHDDPISIVGVVPQNSIGLKKWSELPDLYKAAGNPQLVLERRAYLLQLVKSPDRIPQ